MKSTTFPLGQVLLSIGVSTLSTNPIFNQFIQDSLAKHISCDWGDLCEEDTRSNNEALKQGNRIFSSYLIPDTIETFPKKLWIITEADRSATTILFPSEY